MISLKMHVRYVNFHFLASESPVFREKSENPGRRGYFLGRGASARGKSTMTAVAAVPTEEKAS